MTNLTTTIAKKENLSVNLGIIACIIMIATALSACAVEEEMQEDTFLCRDGMRCARERVAYDMEGETSFVRNTDERKLVVFNFHVGDEAPEDIRPKSITLYVRNGKMINWRETVPMIDSLLLSPEMQIAVIPGDEHGPNVRVIYTWIHEVPWSPASLIHHFVMSVQMREDVEAGTKIEFWLENVTFDKYFEDDSALRYLGFADGVLGDPNSSAVMSVEGYNHAPAGLVFLR